MISGFYKSWKYLWKMSVILTTWELPGLFGWLVFPVKPTVE